MTETTSAPRAVPSIDEVKSVKIDGSNIRGALREQEDVVRQVKATFEDSLYSFDGEQKLRPEKLMAQLRDAHDRLAMLHVVRTRYNLEVRVNVRDPRTVGASATLWRERRNISLMEAVNRVGNAGREANLWRNAAPRSNGRRGSWERRQELTRNKDQERAQSTVAIEDALRFSRGASRFAADLSSAITRGNATVLEMEVPAVLVPLLSDRE